MFGKHLTSVTVGRALNKDVWHSVMVTIDVHGARLIAKVDHLKEEVYLKVRMCYKIYFDEAFEGNNILRAIHLTESNSIIVSQPSYLSTITNVKKKEKSYGMAVDV